MEPSLSFSDTAIAFASQSTSRMRKTYWLFASLHLPWLVRLGTVLTTWVLRFRVPGAAWAVKRTLFEHFCGGETLADCESAVEALGRYRVLSILDYSVEGEKSDEGFDTTTKETLAFIEWGASRPDVPFAVFKVTGIARFSLLEKLGAREPLSPEEQSEWERAHARILQICERTSDLGTRLFIDGEESWIQGIIDSVAEEMMERFNRERVVVYNTYQLYRMTGLQSLRASLQRAKAGGYLLGAKLVRGAYMDKERRRARERGYADPIQPNKAACDASYDAIMFCLDNLDGLAFCAGTHNEGSCMLLAMEMTRRGLVRSDERAYFSQLYGMSDHISFNLSKAGYNVAKYLPYGPVRAVLPYLMRRAEENSSVAGQSGREFRLVREELQRRRRINLLPRVEV